MVDKYVPSGASTAFADISSFVADGNAINASTKTALNLALNNIGDLFGPSGSPTLGAAHPDFNKVPPSIRQKIHAEILQLTTAITAHA